MIRLGTRGSALALAQAGWVAGQLGEDVELVTITVAGDRGAAIGDKSRWVSELEQALLDGEIDLAVHSAKDVPGELADGLELVGVPRRADARDAICGAASLDALPAGARVGTSSLRRRAQLAAARGDVEVVSLRGNVDTRLRKLGDGEVDAIVLAAAGLQRLGRSAEIGGTLDALVPAPGQGTLALEARTGDATTAARAASLIDAETAACLGAERELVRAIGASCNTPVGAHATSLGDGMLSLSAWVGLPDGSTWIADEVRGQAGGLGLAMAERLTAAGARELLDAAEAWQA